MARLARVFWNFTKFVVATFVGAAVIEICHQYKWYPERDLAALIMSPPNHQSMTAAYWIGAAIVGIFLLFAEHWCGPILRRMIVGRGVSVPRFAPAHPEITAPSVTTLGQKAELIKQARQLVIDATAKDGVGTDFRAALERNPAYLALRPYLSDELRESVRRAGRLIIAPPRGSNLPGLAHAFLDELDRIEQDGHAPVATPSKRDLPIKKLARRAKIVFGTDDPFVTVAPSGVNRSRTVRVKIQNESDDEISNGTVSVLNLDPPNKGHKDFLLKRDIQIGSRKHTFVEVAAYSEGTSEAKPAPWIRLLIPLPSGGFLFNGLPGNLPVTPHTFHLQFSTLEDRVLDEVYCRLFVDENHHLHLQDWGNSANHPAVPADREISLMEAATRAYEGIKDRPIAIRIEEQASSPDDILTLVCDELTRYQEGKEPLVKLRGSKPPSRLKDEIYMAPLGGYDFIVEGQAIVFQERHGQMRYESLSVSTSELEPAIQNLAARNV